MARKPKDLWIAYRFADPMCSPRIKQDEDLVSLLMYLGEKETPTIFGPSIHYVPAGWHKRLSAMPIGTWQGGLKIKLFEGASAPPVYGVKFIQSTQFIEGSEDGEEETEVRIDGSSSGCTRNETDDVRGIGGVEGIDDSNEAQPETELDGRGIREGSGPGSELQPAGDSGRHAPVRDEADLTSQTETTSSPVRRTTNKGGTK